MTGNELVQKINLLPEEDRKLPVVISYYDDPESSVPVADEIDDIQVYDSFYPFDGRCISLGG